MRGTYLAGFEPTDAVASTKVAPNYTTFHGLVLASHQLLAIPATHLYPNLVIYYDDGDSSYIHNYGSKYALQHGYPHALPYSMQYPKATSSL